MFGAFDHLVQLLDDMIKHPDLWPLVEVIILGMFLVASVFIMRWANRDRKDHGSIVELPSFIIHGPLHDTMKVVDEIAEETRRATADIREVKSDIGDLDRGQQYTHHLLEAILRNQELRPDPAVTLPAPPTHHRRKPQQ